jgi:hypothetical protein
MYWLKVKAFDIAITKRYSSKLTNQYESLLLDHTNALKLGYEKIKVQSNQTSP